MQHTISSFTEYFCSINLNSFTDCSIQTEPPQNRFTCTLSLLTVHMKNTANDKKRLLMDIKWCHMDDPKGFKLEFFFDTNTFFTKFVLIKVCHMINERAYFGEIKAEFVVFESPYLRLLKVP